MNNKEFKYICPICGKHWETPNELGHCILACDKKKRLEEEQKKAEELKVVKEARRKEVDDAFDKYIELHKAYEKDYGVYIISRNFINGFPWGLFWN